MGDGSRGYERRENDSAVLLLLSNISTRQQKITEKIDTINENMATWKVKCGDCSNETNNEFTRIKEEIKPLKTKLKMDMAEVPFFKKLVNYVWNPVTVGAIILWVSLVSMTFTNSLNTGKNYTALSSRIAAIETNEITFDDMTNIVIRGRKLLALAGRIK